MLPALDVAKHILRHSGAGSNASVLIIHTLGAMDGKLWLAARWFTVWEHVCQQNWTEGGWPKRRIVLWGDRGVGRGWHQILNHLLSRWILYRSVILLLVQEQPEIWIEPLGWPPLVWHGVRWLKFPPPQENSACFPGPTRTRGDHFGTIGPLGTGETQDRALSLLLKSWHKYQTILYEYHHPFLCVRTLKGQMQTLTGDYWVPCNNPWT